MWFRPTRAGVHGADEHEVGGVSDRTLRTRDGDGAILEGLAHDLEHLLSELRQLVEKEDASVAEADLAGARRAAAADEAAIRVQCGESSFAACPCTGRVGLWVAL